MNLKDSFKKELKIYFAQSLFKFENITLDAISTKKLLNSQVMSKLDFTQDQCQVIKNVFSAFQLLEQLDLNKTDINHNLYISLNTELAKEQALFTGCYRSSNVYIPCIEDPIIPPQKEHIQKYIDKLDFMNKENMRQTIPNVFCNLSKLQPFYDGNKRSTMFLCNIALLKKDLGIFFIRNEQYPIFENHLTNFYTKDDPDIFKWLGKNCVYNKDDLENALFINCESAKTMPIF